MSIGYQVGIRVPAHVVTPGLAMLATRDDAAIDAWIAEHDFVGFTAHTVTDTGRFRAELSEAHAQDCWVTSQQMDASFGGISVALKDRKGQCHAAMGMPVLASSYTPTRCARSCCPLLREAAQPLRPLL